MSWENSIPDTHERLVQPDPEQPDSSTEIQEMFEFAKKHHKDVYLCDTWPEKDVISIDQISIYKNRFGWNVSFRRVSIDVNSKGDLSGVTETDLHNLIELYIYQ